MTYTLSVRVVKLGGKDCKFQGEKVCNGGVVKEIGTKLVKICSDGKIKTKTRKSVGEGYPLVGRDTGPGKGKKIFLGFNYNIEQTKFPKPKCGSCKVESEIEQPADKTSEAEPWPATLLTSGSASLSWAGLVTRSLICKMSR